MGGGGATPNLLVFSAYDVSCQIRFAPRLSGSTNAARHPLSHATQQYVNLTPSSPTTTSTSSTLEQRITLRDLTRTEKHTSGRSCHRCNFSKPAHLFTPDGGRRCSCLRRVFVIWEEEDEEEEGVEVAKKTKDMKICRADNTCECVVSIEQQYQLSLIPEASRQRALCVSEGILSSPQQPLQLVGKKTAGLDAPSTKSLSNTGAADYGDGCSFTYLCV